MANAHITRMLIISPLLSTLCRCGSLWIVVGRSWFRNTRKFALRLKIFFGKDIPDNVLLLDLLKKLHGGLMLWIALLLESF